MNETLTNVAQSYKTIQMEFHHTMNNLMLMLMLMLMMLLMMLMLMI